MPDNGSNDRISKLEETAALLVEHAKLSLQHAQIADKRLDNRENQVDRLAAVFEERDRKTDERISSLVSTIGEYIRSDRQRHGA